MLILVKIRSIQEKTYSYSFTNEKDFTLWDSIMAKILTTKEISKYLKLHELTIRKYAAQGEIPAVRIGGVWRFDKDAIDRWIKSFPNKTQKNDSKEQGGDLKRPGKKRLSKRKG